MVFTYKRQLKTIETNSPSLMNNIVMYIVLFNIICLFVFNATFNNISIISWWSVLLVEET